MQGAFGNPYFVAGIEPTDFTLNVDFQTALDNRNQFIAAVYEIVPLAPRWIDKTISRLCPAIALGDPRSFAPGFCIEKA